MIRSRPIILCFLSYYLPGYRGGGPVRSIANLVDHLGEEFDIRIVTRDRDAMDAKPYSGVHIDTWNKVDKAEVFYASSKVANLRGIAKLLSETSHDILYLNSFFALRFATLPLLARNLGWAPKVPCVIAPRGEFSQGALELKATKKQAYIRMVKALGLYRDLYWQASSDFEEADVIRVMGSIARCVHVAPDLTPVVIPDLKVPTSRMQGPVRLVFLSRICPMKNLRFLLRVLGRVSTTVHLAIYGPQEDYSYWTKCKELIDKLPENIMITVGGQVPQERVRAVFAAHDVFLFPTLGENFGHVIFESLTAGTPVLVSDQTPWQSDARGGVTVLPLEETVWKDAIEALGGLDHEAFVQRRGAAVEYASYYAADNKPLEKNRKLFRIAMGQH